MTGKGWLLLGAIAGVAVLATDLPHGISTLLERLVPLPWPRLVLAVLVFWAFAGIHFRSHLVATRRALRSALEDRAAHDSRLRVDLEDATRSAFIVADNLVECEEGTHESRRSMYLDGAKTHARRIVAVLGRLTRQAVPPDSGN